MNFKVLLQNVGATWVVNVVLLLLGFVLLVKGADFFVDGAAGIAKKLKVSTFIIGVTIVAVGTSAPELAVTIADVVKPDGGNVVIGNILGSNVINVFLILGLSAVICKLPSEKSTRMIDMPFLIAISALFLALGVFVGGFDAGYNSNGAFTFRGVMPWWCGLILFILYVIFMVYNVLLAKKQSKANLEQAVASAPAEMTAQPTDAGFFKKLGYWYENMQLKTWFLIVITVVGLAVVVLGAQLVVDSATVIAENLIGIRTEIVALTVVAFGTSLPELITSVSAARKGDVGIATGNIIGSNIANILLIGGVGSLCSGARGIAFTMDGIVGGAVSLLAAIVIFGFSVGSKSKSLGRVAGIFMLMCLVGYYTFLFVNLNVGIYV